MIYAEQLQHNAKVFRFWQYLNNLNDKEYIRAQRHCKHFLGGWVRGIQLVDGTTILNIENQ